ncbi:unnamed protein product [Urochloa decumbens]|uniref:Cytochrome P450 n=1 Tax=Urochloa decumbens TaxID=240449 RepID=A0ABC9DJ10_9POAL
MAQVLLLLIPLLLLSLKFGGVRKNQPRLPPGPWRLPIIGSLHHLFKSPLIHRALADLARGYNAPVMYLQLGELNAVVISSPDAAREVMKTHDVIFATRPLSATVRAGSMIADGLGIAFSPYGERWRQLRKFSTMELLSTKRVRSFRPIREDETARLVTEIAACLPGELVNVTVRVATLVANSALRAMMGEGFRRREELLECITQAIKIATAQAVQRKLFELVDHAVEQHREHRSGPSAIDSKDEDMLDVFLRIQEEGDLGCSLDVGDIKAIIVDLFVGGSEPTATTIQWAMAELMRNPNVMQRAQTELHCALQDKSRVTEDDLGTTDFMGTDFRYTPFGAGRRICPGLAFSLANVELVLAMLLFHFDWQLPPGPTLRVPL